MKRGRPVVVFPQGPATATGSLTKIYDSAAVIAARCDARIVPVRITGTLYTRLRRGRRQTSRSACFPRVTIRVLPAQELPAASPLPGKMRRRRWRTRCCGSCST